MKSLFTLLFIVSLNVIYSQTVFQKYFSMDNYSVAISYPLPDGFLCKGYGANGINEGFCLVKHDGTVSWSQFFNYGSQIFNSLMDPINDLEYNHIVPSDEAIGLFKTNLYSLEWSVNYPEHPDVILKQFPYGINRMRTLSDGKICLAGKSTSVISISTGLYGIECPVVALFEADGTLLWSKMYNIGDANFSPVDLIENAAGDFLITGKYWAAVEGNLTPLGFGTLVINPENGAVAGNGTVNTYTSPNADFSVGQTNGVSKSFVVSSVNNDNSLNGMSSFVVKMNDDGTFSGAKRIDANNPLGSVNLFIMNTISNEMYLAGNYQTTFSESGFTYSNTFCLRTNASMSDVEWAKRYGEEPVDVGGQVLTLFYNSIVDNTDNTILFSGSNETSSGYLWKINRSTGSAACSSVDMGISTSDFTFTNTPVSTSVIFDQYFLSGTNQAIQNDPLLPDPALALVEYCISTGNSNIQENNFSFQMFPNPVNNQLFVETLNPENIHYEVISPTGAIISAGDFKGKTTIQTGNFSSGVYMLKTDNGKMIDLRKFIKN